MKRIVELSVIAAALAAAPLALAQPSGYAGPTASKAATKGKAGMTNAPLMTAKDLLAKGKDDQYARLQGKLVSHKDDEEYEFADASGKMTVEIDDDLFPQGVRIDQNTMVELVGEFDKDLVGEPTLDVKQIKVVTAAAGR
ncbi:YgiW/YdeI family stress tolerance OB fold protein [Massilia niabensis]|uniref:YgiW/YdeI family stress tolerance OB fold protein n=1 Tax=Massilia niabensis TaxID=544910 RepID=A0ABW0L1Z0_9BURK